jgi:hypothetical protein
MDVIALLQREDGILVPRPISTRFPPPYKLTAFDTERNWLEKNEFPQ